MTVWMENPLTVARKLGYSIAGDLGAKAMEELELAYATHLLPKFHDDPIMRVKQNILLYWQFGYYKSTILKVFTETIPANLKTVDISSMSLEKIFGSIDERRAHIIEPAFTNDVHFVIISELTAFLGGRDYKQFADTMNLVLEGEKVSRQTLKLGHGLIDDQELSKLKAKGVNYNPAVGELSYAPNVCVFAATRPLDNKTFTYLNKSGHFSRYHVIQHDLTDKEVSEHLHKNFIMDQEALNSLKKINEQLSKVKLKTMNRPPESLLKKVFDVVENIVRDEISKNLKLKLSDVINPRLKGDIIREFVAHAFLRMAFQNGYREIEELEYTEEDVNFILGRVYHFVEFTLKPLIAEDITIRTIKRSKKDLTKEAILNFLKDEIAHGRKEIFQDVRGRIEVSSALFDIALKDLLDEKRIIQPHYGFYKIKGGE